MRAERTALLIRCSREEAEKIRAAAKRERRIVSGYVLNVVFSRIAYSEQIRRPLRMAGPQARENGRQEPP
jgi:uncharacterized protein (DUF1778 family)